MSSTPTDSDKDLAQLLLGLSLRHEPALPVSSSLPETPAIAEVDEPATETPPQTAQTPVAYPSSPPTPSTEHRTLVIIHPSCIKHKYSRQAPARYISTIVERPERSRAAFLGIAAAKALSLPFDCYKSARLGAFTDKPVTTIHGEWPAELEQLCDGTKELLEAGKVELPSEKYHTGDLYLAAESKEALKACMGGVYDGIDALYSNESKYDKVHVNIRPPGHHCTSNYPSGFCLINNIMIGSAYAVENYGVTRIAILDFDLHHGDGSQEIVYRLNESEKDIKYGYFSLHDIESFPCENGDREKIFGASLCLDGHGQYIWNVHLEGYKLQEEFDKLYQDKYSVLFTHAFKFLSQHTKGKTLVVLSAGFDASEHETPAMQRHKVNVPTLFYDRFTRDSVILAEKTNSKILSVMEGGYSDRAIISGVMSHLSGLSQPEKFLPIEQYCTTQRLGILEKILHCKKLLLKERDAYSAAVSSTFDGLWDSTSPSESQLLTPGMQLRDRRKAPAANRPRRTRGSPVPDIPRQIDVIGSPTPKGMDELVSGVENLSTIPPAESSLLDTPEIKTESQV